MDEIKLVETGTYAPVVKEDYLHVTVEGPSVESLMSPEAKRMAWDARLKYGFSNSMAGIDGGGIAFIKPVAAKAKADDSKPVYLKTFRIFKGL